MQSRTFLRIEGDLVSLVTEVIDREVTLPDLLAELTTTQVQPSPPGCPPAAASGSARGRPTVGLRRRAGPDAADDRVPREPTPRRPSRSPIGSPCRTSSSSSRRYGEQIEGLATYFRTAPIALARRSRSSARPCRTRPTTGSSVSARSGSAGASVGERVDALIGAFWASRFNQDLRRHPLPFTGGFRAWASRSRRDPLAALSLAYDPYWRTLRQVVAPDGRARVDGPAGRARRSRTNRPRPRSGRRTRPLEGGEADALAS